MFRLVTALPVFLGLLTSLALGAPAAEDATPASSFFPTEKGTKWVYEEDGDEWTEVVTAVRTGPTLTLVSVGRVGENGRVIPRGHWAVSARDLFWLNHKEGGRSDPAACLLVFPARAGTAWTSGAGDYKVVGRESVKVPAGTYPAIKVEVTAPFGPGNALVLPLTEHRWYAPGVGLVKRALTPAGRSNSLSERVLKSFELGRDVKESVAHLSAGR